MKRDCVIGFFTDPFPDELLYSACARYHRKARNKSVPATTRCLFGKENIKTVVDFPSRLGYLAAQLPAKTYSVDLLIDEHTLLPLVLPFTSAKQAASLRRDMAGNGGIKMHAKMGLLTSGIKRHYLRFCVGCIADDEASYGQPYWHRLHQVPGVEVCPTHTVFLSESDVPMRSLETYKRCFVTLRQALDKLSANRTIPRPLSNAGHLDTILLKLAGSTASLLQTRVQSDPELIRRRYANLLFGYGLSTFAGVVKQTKLATKFRDYYPSDLLERLGCELKGTNHHWLSRLSQGGESAHHYLHHLLLINFLGSTPEDFFQLPSEMRPFGSGPWPCLNRSVTHFQKTRIAKCDIKKAQNTPQIMGTFTCDCGFSYRRSGFDQSENRRFEYDRILSFGNAWYAKLQLLLAAGYTRIQIASILGVTREVVVTEISRIKRAQQCDSPIIPKFAHALSDPSKTSDYFRVKHREHWTKTLAAHNPSAGRYVMRSNALAAYSWLTVHDREWLNDNLPPVRLIGSRPKKDWSTMDQKYANEVPKIATKIRTAPGPPVRISQTVIAKTLGIHGYVFCSRHLPKTRKVLVNVADTNATYAIRRIQWARDCFLSGPSTPRMWRIWWKGHISPPMASNELVKAEWQRCLQVLESHYNLL